MTPDPYPDEMPSSAVQGCVARGNGWRARLWKIKWWLLLGIVGTALGWAGGARNEGSVQPRWVHGPGGEESWPGFAACARFSPDGALVVGGQDESPGPAGGARVVKYDFASGRILWVWTLPDRSKDDRWVSSLAFDGEGHLAAAVNDGSGGPNPRPSVVGLDPRTGRERWTWAVPGPAQDRFLAVELVDGYRPGFLVHITERGAGNSVRLQTVRLSGTTGEPLWRHIETLHRDWQDHYAPTFALPDGGAVTMQRHAAANGPPQLQLCRVAGADGKVVWTRDVTGPAGWFVQTELVVPGPGETLLIAVGFSNQQRRTHLQFSRWSLATGEPLWERIPIVAHASTEHLRAMAVTREGEVRIAGVRWDEHEQFSLRDFIRYRFDRQLATTLVHEQTATLRCFDLASGNDRTTRELSPPGLPLQSEVNPTWVGSDRLMVAGVRAKEEAARELLVTDYRVPGGGRIKPSGRMVFPSGGGSLGELRDVCSGLPGQRAVVGRWTHADQSNWWIAAW